MHRGIPELPFLCLDSGSVIGTGFWSVSSGKNLRFHFIQLSHRQTRKQTQVQDLELVGRAALESDLNLLSMSKPHQASVSLSVK